MDTIKLLYHYTSNKPLLIDMIVLATCHMSTCIWQMEMIDDMIRERMKIIQTLERIE